MDEWKSKPQTKGKSWNITGKASAREASPIPKNDWAVVLAIDDGGSYAGDPRAKRKDWTGGRAAISSSLNNKNSSSCSE